MTLGVYQLPTAGPSGVGGSALQCRGSPWAQGDTEPCASGSLSFRRPLKAWASPHPAQQVPGMDSLGKTKGAVAASVVVGGEDLSGGT